MLRPPVAVASATEAGAADLSDGSFAGAARFVPLVAGPPFRRCLSRSSTAALRRGRVKRLVTSGWISDF
jgi:hypothetical protein